MAKRKKTWEKTRVQFLYRHKSGGYYARIFAGGNEHWQRLDTTLFEVAKAQLPDVLKKLHAQHKTAESPRRSRLTVGDASEIFLRAPARKSADPKKSTVHYWQTVVAAIFSSWPELKEMEVRKVRVEHCDKWAAAFRGKYSATRFSNACSALKNIFEIGIKEGARYDRRFHVPVSGFVR